VSPAKELRTFGDRQYLLEEAINTDFALVRAALGDDEGNLVFHSSARNFSPLCAMAGRTTIAEVERIVPAGSIDPDQVHLSGVFVQRMVCVRPEKLIERRAVRARVTN
jgi:3-oxoacid CoA-transferase subunit A